MSITLAPGEFKVYGNESVTLSNEDFDSFENDLKLYPNPTSNYFSLNKSVNQIEIYSVTDQLVKRFDGNFEVNHRFNIESLKSGLYFVKANALNGNISVKLLKE